MSEATQPITQRECRQRLHHALSTFYGDDVVPLYDCAEWIVALLSLAAQLAGVPMDRHPTFVEAAADLVLRFKQEAAAGTPGESDQAGQE